MRERERNKKKCGKNVVTHTKIVNMGISFENGVGCDTKEYS